MSAERTDRPAAELLAERRTLLEHLAQLLADAWDVGWEQGVDDTHSYGKTDNPYRAALRASQGGSS